MPADVCAKAGSEIFTLRQSHGHAAAGVVCILPIAIKSPDPDALPVVLKRNIVRFRLYASADLTYCRREIYTN